MSSEIRYFTKKSLIEANKAAIRENRSRILNEDFLESLPDDMPFAVGSFLLHTKDELRVHILFDTKGKDGYLDMSIYRFNLLPIAIMNDDGTISMEDPKITDERRPYPNQREWQEKITRKPVRKQSKFRKDVLKAYGNQCAVCTINKPSLLRAAHIVPVVEDNDDSVNNGICLCVLHEVAFDRGILRITPEGKIITKDDACNIKIDYEYIRLPENKEDHPSKEKLIKREEKYLKQQ